MPSDSATEARTPLEAVFRRIAETPRAVARPPPDRRPQPPRPAAPQPSAGVAASQLAAAEPVPSAVVADASKTAEGDEPARAAPAHLSLAAALLARASAAPNPRKAASKPARPSDAVGRPKPLEKPAPTAAGPAAAPAPKPDVAVPKADNAAGKPKVLAAVLRHRPGEELARQGPAAQAPGGATTQAHPLPPGAGDSRPLARRPRAGHPLAAPGAAPAGESPRAAAFPAPDLAAAALPVADVPSVIVEPQHDPPETAETAVQHSGGRPAMRNRRLYRRVGLDAACEIDGKVASLLDLSMGGFAAANAPELAPNTIVRLGLRLSVDGVEIGARMRARMTYGGAPRSGGRFIDLTASQITFLRYIVAWRNQSVGVLGTATLFNAIPAAPRRSHPVELLPLSEPPARRARWWLRWFGGLRRTRRSAAS